MEALQKALDAINQHTAGDCERDILAATARGLITGYHHRWHQSAWLAMQIEAEFHLPIINPNTGHRSRTFTHAGKWDGICEFEGRRYLLEHKTCSEDITDPNAVYWRRLDIDAQVSGYVLSAWQEGQKLDGTLYDVIRKPAIRPKAIPAKERSSIAHFGRYLGYEITDATRVAVTQSLDHENGELFGMRLAADTLQRPEWYFARKTIARMDSQVLEYANELWQTADEIRLARAMNRHYRNSGACMQWGRPCEYLGICAGMDQPDSDRWQRKEKVHTELATLDGDGRDVLTNSRTSCFKTCKRKHYYRYELGIERLDKDEEEALYFGDLFHHALAAWWSCFLVPTKESTPCPV